MNKKKAGIAAGICAAAVALGLLGWGLTKRAGVSDDSGLTAYVEEVVYLKDTGMVGMVNRYAGLVESQETWSVNQNPEVSVKELRVAVGDEVKIGDVLFVYDTEKYEADLAQAQIDLERMNNEVTTIADTITQLQNEKNRAPASEQANYTIQIQEQQLQQQEKELAIQSKQVDIDKLNDNIQNSEVKSEMDGVVKTINDGSTSISYGSSDNSFITIMKVGDFRIKGKVNEQNIGMLSEGTPVVVYSRVDSSQTWTGTITKVDTENANSNQDSMYYYGDSSANSTSYPFYVQLDSSEGLMLGQHVYMEPDFGQGEMIDKTEGIWIGAYMVDETDPEHPFVWADNGKGKLEKRAVTIGERDDFYYEVQILEGLTDEDKIAIPDGALTEGMTTAPMSEMPMDYYETGEMDETVFSESYYEEMSDENYYDNSELSSEYEEMSEVYDDAQNTEASGGLSGDDTADESFENEAQ